MHHADCGGQVKSHPSFVYVVACGRYVHEAGSVEGPDGAGVVEDRAGQAGEPMAGCIRAARATITSDEYLRAILSYCVVRVV
jgi:hypothetical protein